MAKKARSSVPIVNRRTLSRREREDRYRRWVYLGGGIVLALIVGVLSFGLYRQLVVLPASPIATVNNVVIRTDTYQRWLRYRRYDIRNYLSRLEEQLGQLDPNDANQQALYSYFAQQQQQIQAQLISLDQTTLDELIDDELIRQEAQRRGLAVTPEEVQREIETNFGYDRNPPTPAPTPTAVTATEPLTVTATPSPTPYPTPTPMTEERFQELYTSYIQEAQKNAGFGEADLRSLVTVTLLRNKLQEAMATEVPTTTEQIHARHILVEKEEDAKAALERIQKGEDFATVAKEVSTDTSNKDSGGDLGWFPRGQMVPEFDEAAFALQPGQVSGLVKTTYGYHIIKVEERDPNRPLDESALAERRSQALDGWLSKQRSSDIVRRYWSSDKVPRDKQ